MRGNNRSANELRKIEIIPDYLDNAEGSCLITFGKTKVLCAASVEDKIPQFLKGTGQGWITAEYSLLPRSTLVRTDREAVKGKQNGRTHEIQRLIGRSLRASVDLSLLEEKQIRIDCDVLQADGGTRTVSICGASIALGLAIKRKRFRKNPLLHLAAGVSCGIVKGETLLDLDYTEDSQASVDANFVFFENQEIAEIQVSGEKASVSEKMFLEMLELAKLGAKKILALQKEILLN